MSRGPDAGAQIERAILAALPDARIVDAGWERWASATFSGARHRIVVDSTGIAALRSWLAALSDHDFALRGHVVADASVVSLDATDARLRATLDLLSVEA